MVDVATPNSGLPQRILDITAAVAKEFGVPVSFLSGPRRFPNIVLARSVDMYLLREDCGWKISELAKIFNRDASSVSYAIKRVERRLALPDLELQARITRIRDASKVQIMKPAKA